MSRVGIISRKKTNTFTKIVKQFFKIVCYVLLIMLVPSNIGTYYVKVFYRHYNIVNVEDFESKLGFNSVSSEIKVKNNVVSNKEYKSDVKYDSTVVEDGIALLRIKSCDVKAPIIEGIESEKLKCALGHFPKTCNLGERGNFAVCGHSSAVYDQLLNGLHNIKLGDKIEVITSKKTYIYYASEIKVIMPTALHVLRDFGDSRITLITCTDNGTKRLCVVGSKKKPKERKISIDESKKFESVLLEYIVEKMNDINKASDVGYFSTREVSVKPYGGIARTNYDLINNNVDLDTWLTRCISDSDYLGIVTNNSKEERE